MRVASWEAKISFTARNFPSCLLRKLSLSPLWMCLIHSTENWYQENPMARTGPCWPGKCLLSMHQDFLIKTMNHPPFRAFLSALELFGEKQPGLIISCILYPFYSWKVYMENKNNILSFHPIGSSQGSGARGKKKRLSESRNICKKRGRYLVGAPAQPKSILTLSLQWLEWSTSAMLSNVLITMDRCKRNNKSFLPFICFPDVRVLWSETLDPSSQNGTSDFYFSFLMCAF